MDMCDIFALQDILDPEAEERDLVVNNYKGSVFGDSNKEIAKPFAQMNIKGGRGNQDNLKGESKDNKNDSTTQNTKKNDSDIWNQDEQKLKVLTVPKAVNETRLRPDVDVLYKQAVGTEDVYGGWSGINPSSTSCQFLLIKIKFPQTKIQEISLEVQKQVIVAQSTKYYLNFILPYPVKEKEGKAQWITDKQTLEITLPIIREDIF